MKKNCLICLIFFSFLFLLASSSIAEGGLLPSLTETVGIAMPSLGEALGRYPDEETEIGDGSTTELYTNVSESDFNVFSVYLEQQEAELADYKVDKGVLTAEIRAKGASFSLGYNTKDGEVRVTYPSGTFDEWVKNAKTHFNAAQELLAEGKADEAYAEISAISLFMKYGPVIRLMKEDENLAAAEKAAAATAAAREAAYAPYKAVGNVVVFGTYPQTEEGTDQTPIEWIVLDYDETTSKALLISKYGLDAAPYNITLTDVTWEQCTLRVWLNDEFMKKAFNANEQSAILVTNVDNGSEQGYDRDTDGGNNTQDRIFLLSYMEANRYLGITKDENNSTKPRVAPTEYAISQGAWPSDRIQTADGKPAGIWWLRSPGALQSCVVAVSFGGSIYNCDVNFDYFVVRPAFWLDLESDFFRSVIK